VLVGVAYLLVVVLLAVPGPSTETEIFGFLLAVVTLPGMFVMATAAPPLRGAAWLVAPALAALGVAAAAAYPPALYLWNGLAFERLIWTLLAVAIACPLLIAVYGAAVAVLYARKWAGDETLLIVQWWFVLTLTQAALLGTQGPVAAAAAFLPFAGDGRRAARRRSMAAANLRRGPRTSIAAAHVRRPAAQLSAAAGPDGVLAPVGSVELITGTDLATEVLEPHEFLDYLRGRLERHFVRDTADLDRRLGELDLRPDLDGRYRVNEMCCHADTWRPAVQALVSDVDAVLIDLRGLTASRTGVIHEIECLTALLPVERVVAITDATTDTAVLRWVLDRATALAPAGAPIHDDAAPALRTVTLSGHPTDLARLLDTVGHAACRTAPPATSPGPRGRPA
jgi:hypothetical protein